jgi:phosphatidate cytidylyltransferase
MAGVRILTAALLIPAVVAIVWWAPTAVVAAVAALVMLLALAEFFVIAEQAGLLGFRIWTGLCGLGVCYAQLVPLGWPLRSDLHFAPGWSPGAGWLLLPGAILPCFALGAIAIIVFGQRPVTESLAAISTSSAALVFIVIPFSTIIPIHAVETRPHLLLLFTLVLVWAGDTLAYFVGRWAGRHRIAPRISPQKTWEGAAANLAGSLIVALIFSRWLVIPERHVLLMAVLANIAGQGGDLLESAYKRSAGVKDSGSILPGHGGMLDRIDALIFAAPVVWYYFAWLSARPA